MSSREVFNDEMLRRAAAELVEAINNSLPLPEEYQYVFSNEFEKKMQ